MNVKECLKGAFLQLWGSKLRTFLTMLGMFIGIGSVIMVLSVGEGVKDMITGVFSDIGKGTVMIYMKDTSYENLLTQEDLDALVEMEEIDAAIMYAEIYTVVRNYQNEDRFICIMGTPHNMSVVQNLEFTAGRMFTEAESRAKSNVVVVSDMYAKVINGDDDPESILGTEIELRIDGKTGNYEVIGLVESVIFPGMPEEAIPLMAYIPFTTLDQIMGFGGRAYTGGIKVGDDYDPNEVAYQVQRLLDRRHGTDGNYSATAAIQMIDQINTVVSMLTTFIGFVAAISLLVGGIGIMNIMLVTVKERTREIGIRKAIGATNGEILQQFLIEAIILTMLGGLIGMLFGYTGGLLIGQAIDLEVKLTSAMIIFSVGVSSIIGITFGVYPAYQASKLDPIEALRYE
ncbi:MAG: hypothetical protein ATN36_04005 [Epulopiscium sp. Nele67-Bin005]|nr:MAG: hypothetical protein ATN36_04005 [Epulopiscium sp. Nele67-Bin005]